MKIYCDYRKMITCPLCKKEIRSFTKTKHFEKEHFPINWRTANYEVITKYNKEKDTFEFLIECGRYPVFCDCGCEQEICLSAVKDKNRKVLKYPLSKLLNLDSGTIKYFRPGHREKKNKKTPPKGRVSK